MEILRSSLLIRKSFIILWSILISFGLASQEVPNSSDGIILRKFLSGLIEASGKKTDLEKSEAVKETFLNHPESIKWIIEGKDLNSIIKEADLPELSPEIQSNLQRLNQFQSLIVTSYQKLKMTKDAISHVANFKELAVPVIVNNILLFNPSLDKTLLMNLGKKALIGMLILESEKRLKDSLNNFSKAELKTLLDNVPSSVFLKLANKLDQGIADAKFSQTPAINMIKDPKTGFDFSSAPKKLQDLFDSVLTGYYDNLGAEDKRRLVLGLLELPPGASEVKKLSSILNNSGPALQKLFQLLGKDVKSPIIAEVMNELKSNIRPFSEEQARSILEESYGQKLEDVFSEFRFKPLAAASVGQVHLAKLKGSGREVIVKIMRPGLEGRAKREIETLMKLAPDTGTKKIISRLEESLMEELDFNIEAQNLKEGEIYIRPDKGIVPVKLAAELPVKKNVLVMEKAPGKTIDKVSNFDLPSKGKALSDFLEIWFDEALFQGGFFHGDLHAGNIFFKEFGFRPEDAELKKTSYPEIKTDYILTPIDFGSASRLTPEEQRGILKFALGSIFKSPKTIIKSFALFHEMTPEQESKFSEIVYKIVSDESKTPIDIMNEILNKAIELEFNVPKNLILFNRGRMFLEKQLAEVNQQLKDDEYEYFGNPPQYEVFNVYRNVVIKRLSADIVKRMLGVYDEDEEDAFIDSETISDLVDEFFIPTAKKYAKKAGRCAVKGLYYGSYLYLQEMFKFMNFLSGYPSGYP